MPMFEDRIPPLLQALGLPNPDRVYLPTDIVAGWKTWGSAADDAKGLAAGSTTAVDLTAQYACKSKALLETFQGGSAIADPKMVGILYGVRCKVTDVRDDAGAVSADGIQITDMAQLDNVQYLHHKTKGQSRYIDLVGCWNSPEGAIATTTGVVTENGVHATKANDGALWFPHDPIVVDYSEDTFETAAQRGLENSHTFLTYLEFFGVWIDRNLVNTRAKDERSSGGLDNIPVEGRTALIKFISQNMGNTALPGA